MALAGAEVVCTERYLRNVQAGLAVYPYISFFAPLMTVSHRSPRLIWAARHNQIAHGYLDDLLVLVQRFRAQLDQPLFRRRKVNPAG
ncbi:hypothetical protein [Nocardia testacea]|uniref:hypothetical protein n=1 Tax=Nocardia testacea TaxID=248551 RepID=UPI003A8A7DE3